ncbi:MAG: hypothetical protein A2293_02725 [Elusimicrobia bacterium RIFOXYB2_FULL_49_7]|nr:MAG: hypothetical protein A2293_02725 [Elusimicrobia bacterium RIFOXYB2_FULL_49_7]
MKKIELPLKMFFQNLSYNALLRIKESGEILEVVTPAYYNPQNLNSILLKRNVYEFFDLPDDESLLDIALPLYNNNENDHLFSRPFLSKNLFESYHIFYEIHASIPYSKIVFCHTDDREIFGIIRFNGFVSKLLPFNKSPFIVLSRNGDLVAFNRMFLDLFQGQGKTAKTLLNKPVWSFSNPNPLELLTGQEKEFRDLLNAPEWRVEYHFDFLSDSETALDATRTKDTRKIGQGLFWEPSRQGLGLLPIGQPFDFSKQDFKIEMILYTDNGNLPSLLLGISEEEHPVFPDYQGYLVGPLSEGKKWVMKREGEELFVRTFENDFIPGEYRIQFYKRGNRFSFFLNDTFQIGYRDMNPPLLQTAQPYLYNEALSPLLLRRITVYASPRLPALEQASNEINILSGTENRFQFRQIADNQITYILKQFHYVFILNDITQYAHNIRTLEQEKERASQERDRFKELALRHSYYETTLIGETPAITIIRKNAEIAAIEPVSILIEGETGTGKEVLAHHIHQISRFRDGPFIKVDCATIPQSLLESELFGHEKGAFTGATQQRMGRFEEADGGTLFLDEIGNIPLSIQIKLLQFIQDFTVTPIGGNHQIQVKARLIAATNAPLKQLVDEKLFRSDLYYRLNIVRFQLPPLRERKEDIPLLCHRFLDIYTKKFNRRIKHLTSKDYEQLIRYDWPGNIRELENVIQKAILFSTNETAALDKALLKSETTASKRKSESEVPVGDTRAFTRAHLLHLLEINHGIIARAVRESGMAKSTFFRKLKEFKITKKEVKSLDKRGASDNPLP